MEKAIYHQEGREPQTFNVLNKHKDGTLDIGPEGGEAVVTCCPVSSAPSPGFATIAHAVKPDAPVKTKK